MVSYLHKRANISGAAALMSDGCASVFFSWDRYVKMKVGFVRTWAKQIVGFWRCRLYGQQAKQAGEQVIPLTQKSQILGLVLRGPCWARNEKGLWRGRDEPLFSQQDP